MIRKTVTEAATGRKIQMTFANLTAWEAFAATAGFIEGIGWTI